MLHIATVSLNPVIRGIYNQAGKLDYQVAEGYVEIMERIIHNVDIANQWVLKIVSFLYLPLALIVTYEVIMRYALSKPQMWTWDVDLMLFGTIGVMGGGYVLLERQHIRVDALVGLFSDRMKRITNILSDILLFIGAGVLFWKSLGFAWDSIMVRELTTGTWNAPLYPLKIIFVLGIALLLLQGIVTFIRDVTALFQPQK